MSDRTYKQLSAEIQDLMGLVGADPSLAEGRVRELLKENTQEPQLLLLLATALRRQGNIASAHEILSALVQSQPAMAQAHYELGMVFIARRQNRDATRHLRRAVELDPVNADAWNALSDQLLRMRHRRSADVAHAQAFMASEENPKLRAVAACLQETKFEDAERLLGEILSADPENVKAIKLMAELGIHAGRLDIAEALLVRCLELAPDFLAARYRYATVLLMLNKLKMTLAQLEELGRRDPGQTCYRSLKADALARMGDFECALAEYEATLNDDPEQPAVWIDYGHALNVTGKHDEAAAAFRKAMELIPGHGEAYWRLANLKRFRFAQADVEAMCRQIARADMRGENRSYFHFALGKALEDDRQWQEAFEHYRKANEFLRPAIAYNAADTSERVRRVKAFFTAELFARRAGAGCGSAGPIFIVGLPRSGTTLLEQILASHSAVEATGGLHAIEYMAARLAGKVRQNDSGENYPEVLGALDEQELRALGEQYFKRARAYLKSDKLYFIDRMPLNFLHLGFIHLILPGARIIDARRHPLACCFSNYRQHYGPDNHFSYGMADLGRYYSDYIELMAHFDEVLPGRVHRVFYEQLVENSDREIRRLFEYLGLPFEERCLRFYENARPVQGPSAQQVRMPIYREAVDHWKHFEPWLEPLKEALGFVLHAYPGVPSFYGRLHAEVSQMPSNWTNDQFWSANLQMRQELGMGTDA